MQRDYRVTVTLNDMLSRQFVQGRFKDGSPFRRRGEGAHLHRANLRRRRRLLDSYRGNSNRISECETRDRE